MSQLKDLAFWDWEYLSTLPAGEHDWIDYKDSRFLEKNQNEWLGELSEYLSAFSNYDGGYIVIGMVKQPDGTHIPDQGVLLRTLKIKDWKEWLEDKLPAQTDPPLTRIAVTTIPSLTDGDRGAIVIYVPESTDAPHQGHNDRFYVRTGSKNRALKTRQIFDIRGRIKHPVLQIEATFLIQLTVPFESTLRIIIRNDSYTFCNHYKVELEIPTKYKEFNFNLNDQSVLDIGKGSWTVAYVSTGPLFPRATKTITFDFSGDEASLLKFHSSDRLKVRLFADAAPFRDFSFSIDDIAVFFDPPES